MFDWCSHLHTYIQTIGNTARSLADDHLRATNWNCQHQVLLIIERQMLALHDSAVERAEELKASSEKLTKLVPLVSKFCQWVRRVNELMLVVCTSIKQLGAIDQRATAFSTLMSAKVDNEQRQGIFVSISTARLEYFNKLVVSLVYTMGNQEEFDRWFDLLKRLIALELGEVENVTEKEVDEKVSSFVMAFWLLADWIL